MCKQGWLSLINVARAHFNNIILATKAKLRPEEVCQEKESIEKKTQESEQKTGIIDDIKHAPTYKTAMGEK